MTVAVWVVVVIVLVVLVVWAVPSHIQIFISQTFDFVQAVVVVELVLVEIVVLALVLVVVGGVPLHM